MQRSDVEQRQLVEAISYIGIEVEEIEHSAPNVFEELARDLLSISADYRHVQGAVLDPVAGCDGRLVCRLVALADHVTTYPAEQNLPQIRFRDVEALCGSNAKRLLASVMAAAPILVGVAGRGGHGTSGGWHSGCRCTLCRQAHSDTQRAFGRTRAQQRLPAVLRQQLLDGIYAGQPFRSLLRDLGLTPNQVWGLTKTDAEWAAALEEALTAIRRTDLRHGTNAAYVAGCVCKDCREHQRQRMAKNRGGFTC
jgi:hypothetical protein